MNSAVLEGTEAKLQSVFSSLSLCRVLWFPHSSQLIFFPQLQSVPFTIITSPCNVYHFFALVIYHHLIITLLKWSWKKKHLFNFKTELPTNNEKAKILNLNPVSAPLITQDDQKFGLKWDYATTNLLCRQRQPGHKFHSC